MMDVLIIGAGFSGVYLLHRLRQHGFEVKVVEAGASMGGIWFWNCYPGARCDSDIPNYQLSMQELWRDWHWTERFPDWQELRKYFEHVDQTLDLSRDIRFNTRVTGARFNTDALAWQVECENGERLSARFVVACTGFGSKPYVPEFPGLEEFSGACTHTALWPQDGLPLSGKRVGVIGTGASGVQVIQEAGRVAAHLSVFQRTPNLALAMQQQKLDGATQQAWKLKYPEWFAERDASDGGMYDMDPDTRATCEVSDAERERVFEAAWQKGGFKFWIPFSDTLSDVEANRLTYDFWRAKVLPRIKDPAIAEKLAPAEPPHPFGTKRPSLEQWYYEVFNQDNVTLIDLGDDPIEAITATGIRTATSDHALDVIVMATGFDAGTGGLTQIDFRDTSDRRLADLWSVELQTHLGIGIPGFPNLFMVYGPQSPSAFWNGPTASEIQGDWVTECLCSLRDGGITRMEATAEAATAWTRHMAELADDTLLPHARSWYMGANIPGKPIQLLHYFGAIDYMEHCRESARNNYSGFVLS